MEKKVINVTCYQLLNSTLVIEFNDYEYIIEKEDIPKLKHVEKEDDMLEIFPGIYLNKIVLIGFIPLSINIHICNYRDTVKVYLHQNDIAKELFCNIGNRIIYVKPCNENDIVNKKIPFDSIHYPEHETGGWGSRCYIKPIFHNLNLYPTENSIEYNGNPNKEPYYLFDYEEIFHLPSHITLLKNSCKKFCYNRNSENNKKYVITKGGNQAANELVNTHFSGAVSLILNNDNTLSIGNGNHRICFLKRFYRDLDLDTIKFERVSESYLGNNHNSNGILDTHSYYEQLQRKGVSRKEAKMILLDGMNSTELFNYLLKNKYIDLDLFSIE